jgi:hypothetical protein
MISERTIFSICVTIILVCSIIAVTTYKLKEDVLKNQNIEQAINKGIDPLPVRCSYSSSQDTICVAYAASKK